jgi:hypothetical protein
MGTFNRLTERAFDEGKCCLCWKPAPQPDPETLAETGMPVCDACAPGALRDARSIGSEPQDGALGDRPQHVPGFITAGEAVARALSQGGRLGILAGALREIAQDMPGVRAPHKRTAMRERAERALQELEQSIAIGDAGR